MLFNSYVFLFAFLPVTLCFWWLLKNVYVRLIALTLLSYFFYSWWNWKFVPLMIASTTVDYIAGQKIVSADSPRRRKAWLACSMTFNLLVLGFFKYFDFFAHNANRLLTMAGTDWQLPILAITLPVGISFYTFNSMSYTIDLYRGIVRPARSIVHFSAFVAMFPHLVAGPIVRFSDVEQQLSELKQRLSAEQASRGIYFFVCGLAKKLLIADRLAPFVNAYFSAPDGNGVLAAWTAVIGYSLQLYFDFSGYSDMAVGLAHMLGIQFPKNFDSPYRAQNIADFWRRWHISLSTWLRDYLFIPLGGSKGSMAQTTRNLFLTMFLGGLWHGAGWTFAVWGIYHGVLLALYHVWGRTVRVPAALGRAVTLLCVALGWVIFRSDSFSAAMETYRQMLGMNGMGAMSVLPRQLFLLVIAGIFTQVSRNTFEIGPRLQPRPAYALGLTVMFVLAVLYLGRSSPFLYFQF